MTATSALLQTFNIGTDATITIIRSDTGEIVNLDGKKTKFSSKDKSKLLESQPIDDGGLPDHRVVPGGWSGTIDVDKATSDFGIMYAAWEAGFFQSGPQIYWTIQLTEPKADQSGEAKFGYLKAVFHGYDPGTWAKEDITKVTVAFDCQQRVQI